MHGPSLGRRFTRAVTLCTLAALGLLLTAGSSPGGTAVGHETYTVTNLVSDGTIPAAHTDANLVNAWGLTATASSPWWVANNATGTSTLYNGDGVAQFGTTPLVVSVPNSPTGAVANTTSDFVVSSGGASGRAVFIFATEDGTIRGWNPGVPPPTLSTETEVAVDNSTAGSVYKGLAIGSVGSSNFLYATDFVNGHIDVFDKTFHAVDMPFVDPGLPAGYGPFGIQNIGGHLFVTYAKQSGGNDEVAGQSLGFVDEFETDGTFITRVATRGQLNAPWGLAMAPSNFGRFSGDLLVGNFGDGTINAYAPQPDGTFAHRGQLRTADRKPVTIDGLWGLGFGNGAGSGATNALYFTAGPDDESHGLFGRIQAQ
ncbi:MAG: TIGR03118 family protein [Actinobacteria bacterium]|nr:MAG: TIGR03118 family protein [Actinomycetota bacterium]